MSDLSLQLQQAASPLSVQSYFDPALFAREQERLFRRGPRYVGHALSVPNVGDYYALPQEQRGRALVRTATDRIELISNVCCHRQARILDGRGSLHTTQPGSAGGNIVCPVHRWTYAPDGKLIGAPHFDHDPGLDLTNYPLRSWNGLLFEDNGRDVAADLATMGMARELSFEGYVLDHVELHPCHYNWKTFIEVYLEDYHVGPFHPGLGHFVTCDDLHWQFGREFSVQAVGVAGGLKNSGSPVYERWHRELLKYSNGQLPRHGAIWLTYYPHIMVEWYPHVLTVSTLHPVSARETLNMVEFYYPEEIAAFERDFVEAQRAAYMETCLEDDEIAEREDEGRQILMRRGDDARGPYQHPLEDGMQHFHAWYRRALGMNGTD